MAELVKNLYNTWQGLTVWEKSRTVAFCAVSAAILFAFYKRRQYKSWLKKVKSEGLRSCDPLSAFWLEESIHRDTMPTIHGISVVKDVFDFKQAQRFTRVIATDFINFRSEFVKRSDPNGVRKWFMTEIPVGTDEFETMLERSCVHIEHCNLPKDFDRSLIKDDETAVNEVMIQQMARLLNGDNMAMNRDNGEPVNHIELNPDWWNSEENRGFPHWKVTYFSFGELGRSLFYVQLSHSIGDGVALGITVDMVFRRMFGGRNAIEQMLDEQQQQKQRQSSSGDSGGGGSSNTTKKITMSDRLYFMSSLMSSVFGLIKDLATPSNHPPQMHPKNKRNEYSVAVSPAFSVARLKEYQSQDCIIPDGLKPSINDYFLRATMQGMREYLSLSDDQVQNELELSMTCSTRGWSLKEFESNMLEYEKQGTNANALASVKITLEMTDQPNLAKIKQTMRPLKYGGATTVLSTVLGIVYGIGALPEIIKDNDEHRTIVASNMRGPLTPFPISDEGDTAEWGFGFGLPCSLSGLVSLQNYNDELRLTLCFDDGNCDNLDVLLKCILKHCIGPCKETEY